MMRFPRTRIMIPSLCLSMIFRKTCFHFSRSCSRLCDGVPAFDIKTMRFPNDDLASVFQGSGGPDAFQMPSGAAYRERWVNDCSSSSALFANCGRVRRIFQGDYPCRGPSILPAITSPSLLQKWRHGAGQKTPLPDFSGSGSSLGRKADEPVCQRTQEITPKKSYPRNHAQEIRPQKGQSGCLVADCYYSGDGPSGHCRATSIWVTLGNRPYKTQLSSRSDATGT
ncbi:hypothetical protein ACVMB0_000166 [Bradyrhizobium sp. USDA 4451]